jgi:hypothetical protein
MNNSRMSSGQMPNMINNSAARKPFESPLTNLSPMKN